MNPPWVGESPTPRTTSFSELAAFGFWMQKQGYRHSTITSCISTLKPLTKRINILNPEAAKEYLAKLTASEGRKEKITEDLARFYKYKEIKFDKPRYTRIEKLPFIPLESEIQQLISGYRTKTAAFLSLLKETGMRPGEAWNLKWIDLDFNTCIVNVTPEKNSKAGQYRLPTQLTTMINTLPRKTEHIFHTTSNDHHKSLEHFRRNFELTRRIVAQRFQNPRLLSISFRTMRHYKATMEYAKTKDILWVQKILRHRSLRNTLRYTQLINFESDEYVCKAAETVDEATQLIENGFEYVTNFQDTKLFRKRK